MSASAQLDDPRVLKLKDHLVHRVRILDHDLLADGDPRP
jgi:hypothetical protein